MRTGLVAQMQQRLHLLAEDCFRGGLSEASRHFFLPEVYCYLPDLNLEGKGIDIIDKALAQLWQNGRQILHLIHNWAQAEREEDVLYGHCNSYGYELCSGKGKIRFGYFRIELQCVEQQGQCRIKKLSVMKLLSITPWKGDYCRRKLPAYSGSITADAREYICLRNLVGRYARTGYQDWPSLLAGKGEICLNIEPYFDGRAFEIDTYGAKIEELARKEADNSQMYLFHVSAVTNPVFSIQEGAQTAVGRAYGIVQFFRGACFGYDGPPYPMDTQLGMWEFSFEKEQGLWMIRKAGFTAYAVIKEQKYYNERDFKHSDAPFGRSELPKRSDKTVQPEAVFEIESMIAWWVDYLKRGESEKFPGQFMENSLEEISMNLSNHTFHGYDEIFGRCEALIGPFIKQHPSLFHYPQIHSGNTPVIELDADGIHGMGTWYDMAFGNIGGNVFFKEEETQRTYFPGLGIYNHCFVKDRGKWKLYKFCTGVSGIWGLEQWPFDTRTVGGWSGRRRKGPWPLPFEEFRYPD